MSVLTTLYDRHRPFKELLHPSELSGDVIERLRADIYNDSNAARSEHRPPTSRILSLITQRALTLLASKAPEFSVAATLTHAAGNLTAAGAKGKHMNDLRKTARRALEAAYPVHKSKENANEIEAHLLAIEHTTCDVPFAAALEQAHQATGLLSTDQIIASTDMRLFEHHLRQRRAQRAAKVGYKLQPSEGDDTAAHLPVMPRFT